MDNCYSSEIAIDTLTDWKDNMIFTTGYIQDYYSEQETGMIKAIKYVAEAIKKEKGLSSLSYRILKENKDFVNQVLDTINNEYGTEYNLF